MHIPCKANEYHLVTGSLHPDVEQIVGRRMRERASITKSVSGASEVRSGGVILYGVSATPPPDIPEEEIAQLKMSGEDAYLLHCRTHADTTTIAIVGNRIRGMLYGVYQLAECIRNGEAPEAIAGIHQPSARIRGDYSFVRTYRSGKADNRRRLEKIVHEYPRLRINTMLAKCSMNRNFVISGYPDYQAPSAVPAEGLTYTQQAYALACAYDMDFYYDLKLVPTPAHIGFFFESSLGMHCLDNRVPMKEPFFKLASEVHQRYPEYFNEQGEPRLDSPIIRILIAREMQAAMEHFPKLKGFVLYVCECGGHGYFLGRIRSQGPYIRNLEKLISMVREIADPHGLDIILFTHFGFYERGVMASLWERLPSWGVTALHEINWGPQLPTRKFYGDMRRSAEADKRFETASALAWILADAEHTGRGHIPYCIPEHFRNMVKASLDYGMQGTVCRQEREFMKVLDSLEEVNLVAWAMTAWDANVRTEDIWKAWIRYRFHPDLVDALSEILQLGTQAHIKGMYIAGIPVIELVGSHANPETFLAASIGTNGGLRYPVILDLFQKPATPYTAIFQRRRDQVMAEEMQNAAPSYASIRQAQQEAVQLCEQACAKLETVRDQLSQEDGVLIQSRLDNLRDVLHLVQRYVRCLYYEKLTFHENYDAVETPDRQYRDAVYDLEQAAYAIMDRREPTFFFGICRGMTHYVFQAFVRLNAFKDGAGRQTTSSIRTPLQDPDG